MTSTVKPASSFIDVHTSERDGQYYPCCSAMILQTSKAEGTDLCAG